MHITPLCAEYKTKMDLRVPAGRSALRKMMPEKQQPCSRTGRSWILIQLHKIHSKNKGKGEGGWEGGRGTRREDGEAKMEGRGVRLRLDGGGGGGGDQREKM